MCLSLLMSLSGCFGKLSAPASPTPIDTATAVAAVAESPLKCPDRAMEECPGVDPADIEPIAERLKRDYPALAAIENAAEAIENAAEAIALGSLAMEQLEVCRLNYHAELVDCIADHQRKQAERRQRMGGGQ